MPLARETAESTVGRDSPTLELLPNPGSSPATAELEHWMRQLVRLETLFGLELAAERDRILVQHREHPTDGSRLALAYILSRPQVLVQDMDKSRTLLGQIDANGVYAPLRDLLLREFAMTQEIADLRQETSLLQSQLAALKAIETDLSDNQKELEEDLNQ